MAPKRNSSAPPRIADLAASTASVLKLGFRVKFRAVEGSGWWHV